MKNRCCRTLCQRLPPSGRDRGRRRRRRKMGPRLPPHACFSRVVQGQHESLSQTETQATQWLSGTLSCSDFPSLSGASGIVFFRTVVFDWTLVFRLSSDTPAAADDHLTACYCFPFKSPDKVSHFRRCQRFPKRQKAGVQTFNDL